MKLTVLERVLVSGLLPEKGSYDLLVAANKLKDELGFNEEEVRKYDISGRHRKEDGRYEVTFNVQATHGYEKDVKVNPTMLGYLETKLKEMSDNGDLEQSLISIYEKFVA